MQNQPNASPAQTLAQRFFANSTPLFKILGAVGAFMVICSTVLMGIGIPVVIPAIVGSAGSVLVIVMFIEADMAKVAENPDAGLKDYLAVMPQVADQFRELITAHKAIIEAINKPQSAAPYIPADVAKAAAEVKTEAVQNG